MKSCARSSICDRKQRYFLAWRRLFVREQWVLKYRQNKGYKIMSDHKYVFCFKSGPALKMRICSNRKSHVKMKPDKLLYFNQRTFLVQFRRCEDISNTLIHRFMWKNIINKNTNLTCNLIQDMELWIVVSH